MTPEFEQWLSANDNYLSLALAWLRTRLDQLAQDVPRAAPAPAAPVPAPSPGPRPRPVLGRLFPGSTTAPLQSLPPPAPIAGPRLEGEPAPPPQAMLDAEQADPPPALMMLARRMGLTRFETMTMLMCVAIELDPQMAALYGRAQGDAARSFPTFALAMKLFADPSWDVMSPERPLRHWRLIEVVQGGGQQLVASAIRADERIVNYVKGLNYLDEALAPLLTPAIAPLEPLPPSQQALADAIESIARRGFETAKAPLIQLLGADSQGKLLVAHAAAYELDLSLYRLNAEQIPTQTAELDLLIRLWRREAALLPLALLVEAGDIDRAGVHAAPLTRLMERDSGLMIVDTREPWPETTRETVTFDVARPSAAEQAVLWREALGAAAGDHPRHLSAHFNFNAPAIRHIANSVLRDGGPDLGQALWNACLQRARPALDQLARVVEAKSGWDDLELPETEKGLLRQIIEQVRTRGAVYDDWGFRERMNRGLGISVLFAGESGTGKTMAAEVIARELGLLIFRIDLSAVVSKYIGETEKNLRKLFDAAEDGGAILFFDEADALFGKRSEVRDSHDRYANIEVNYLLQRIESFRGLAILASNMKSSLDSAFLRRLRFVVNFPFPGPAERAAIWKSVFPPQVPLARLDYDRLGRLNLTGGSIHNIALNAAFVAAGRDVQVSMPLLLESARTELRKLDKPINEADLRWVEPAPIALKGPA
jgi:hypothetical protein